MWTMNFQMFKLVLEKAEERTRDQIANIQWNMGKAREFQKNIYFCFIDYAKAFDCVDHNKLWKILKEMGIPEHWPSSWEICMQVRKQQLELEIEQLIGSKLGKKYVKAVYYYPVCLTYMQCTSWEMPGWRKHRLESRLPGEITITDMQITPPYGRKWRTEEPLGESERGEWKSWLKAQHSENEDHGIWSHHFMANRCGTVADFVLVPQNHCRWRLQPCN